MGKLLDWDFEGVILSSTVNKAVIVVSQVVCVVWSCGLVGCACGLLLSFWLILLTIRSSSSYYKLIEEKRINTCDLTT